MSSKSTSALLSQRNQGFLARVTRSILSRQLLSSIIITILGFSILSWLYYYNQQAVYIEKQKENFLNIDYALNGMISFAPGTGRYYINTEEIEPEIINETLVSLGLTSEVDINFAYILNSQTDEVVWHSQGPGDVNYQDASKPAYKKKYQEYLPVVRIEKQIKNDETHVEILGSNISSTPDGRNFSDGRHLVYYRAFSDEGYSFYMIIAKSTSEMQRQNSELLKNIFILIGIAIALVFISQLINGYLVVKPVKQFENEIKEIESGKKEFVKGKYPTELLEVKGAINALVHVEKGQKKRYREALDNLAHSLKTPLAVLQGIADNETSMHQKQCETLEAQVLRMNDIIAYQLRRAVVSDHNANIKRQPIRPILYRLKSPLQKVHHDKDFTIELNVDENAECRMDADDLMEVFGNLMNNACRFCQNIVSVTATHDTDTLIVDIDDDGMGFPDKNPSSLLKRGMRADNKTEGQGIGLAVSNEIVEAAGGRIELLVSPYVGARVRLHLPV